MYPSKCIGMDKCSLCLEACPQEGSPLVFVDKIVVSAMQEQCREGCMACAAACPASALIRWGEDMTVAELMKVIVADRSLYRKSGGGVTLSGGEVMMQWEFACELLQACKKSSIGTCVESALHCKQEIMEAVYEHTDLVITDIKHMDDHAHKLQTGVGNKLILENIERTAELNKKLVIRIPVMPAFNDDEGNIKATGAFIRDVLQNRVLQVQLLPYRKLGTAKYESLNLPYPLGSDYTAPDRAVWEANILRLTDILTDMGIPATAGSNVKYQV